MKLNGGLFTVPVGIRGVEEDPRCSPVDVPTLPVAGESSGLVGRAGHRGSAGLINRR